MATHQTPQYDPYYRDFPSNLLPVRTPFTRPGRRDAGQVFVYMTRKWVRWSLLLDHTHMDSIYEEARQCIPAGFSQFWLLQKRYSTPKPGAQSRSSALLRRYPYDQFEPTVESKRPVLEEKLTVVLREPLQQPDGRGDVLSYHLREAEAVAAAEAYTRQFRRRAIVARLLWDELWF